MDDLKTVAGLVRSILEHYPQTRSSDSYLYLKVLEHQAHEKEIDLRILSVPVFLMEMEKLGFSGFETVRRARQKVQQHYPDLAASKPVKKFRDQNETVFRAFALGDC